MSEFQPRFAAYAHAHGQLPQHLPTGSATNLDFVRWVTKQWKTWETMEGIDSARNPRTMEMHQAFDAWLAKTYPAPEEAPATRPEGRRSRTSGL